MFKELHQHREAAAEHQKAAEDEQPPSAHIFEQAHHGRGEQSAAGDDREGEAQKPVAAGLQTDIEHIGRRGRVVHGHEDLTPGMAEPAGQHRQHIEQRDAQDHIAAPGQRAVELEADRKGDQDGHGAEDREGHGAGQIGLAGAFGQTGGVAFFLRFPLRVPDRRMAQRAGLDPRLQLDAAFDTVHVVYLLLHSISTGMPSSTRWEKNSRSSSDSRMLRIMLMAVVPP